MATGNRRVAVLGGGVIGAACAYYLSERGWDVTIFEQGEFGKACSHGNCGYISPSHLLPLAEPGVVSKSLRSMLTPNSPFRIQPRIDPTLWKWLYRFARRCNLNDRLAAAQALDPLLRSSRDLYDELLAKENIRCEWEAKGMLFVFQSPAEFEHYGTVNEFLANEFDRPAKKMGAEELVAFEPALKPGVSAGAWYYDCDAHLRPDKLMSELKRVLLDRNVRIFENCPVKKIIGEGGRAVAVQGPTDELAVDAVVVAAGALSPTFGRDLGCPIPVQPGKGLSITTTRPGKCPTYPMIFHDHRVAITPMQSGYRIGSTMEFAGYNPTINPKRLSLLGDAARLYLHEGEGTPTEAPWYGWRPMTYDSLPIIGPSPKLSNAYLATGHSMLGVSLATGTGKLLAELMSGEPPHVKPAPYAVTRF